MLFNGAPYIFVHYRPNSGMFHGQLFYTKTIGLQLSIGRHGHMKHTFLGSDGKSSGFLIGASPSFSQ